MAQNALIQISLYLIILLFCAKPLGSYIAFIYDRKIHPLENYFHRFFGMNTSEGMNWKTYLMAMLVFNFVGFLVVYAIERGQFYLPLNPQHFSAPSANLAFNTAVSFVTNTNWQAYSGEQTMSYLTQMSALTVQNFLSAATGLSIVIALIRALRARENENLGNFWIDIFRGILYILLPLSFILAILLSSQGVIQNVKPNLKTALLEPITYQQPTKNLNGNLNVETVKLTSQVIPMGPVASQVAIKQLGSNGGGFFNVNASHPFENPTPISNFLEMIAILLIPAALCFTFGKMLNDKRQGWAILITMLLIFIPLVLFSNYLEQRGNPALKALGVDQIQQTNLSSGGNMEGKETRFGIVNSTLWASATTAASNGSVNAMYDSFTPLAGLFPLWTMHLGEVIFGGVGSGLYGMLLFIILTVFVTGLMVGRTPEYLGKKIEPYEMKMACFGILILPLIILFLTALAVVLKAGTVAIFNSGPHGFSEILYAFTSMTNNNGSAFSGLNANNSFYNILGGLAMLFGRYWIAISTLAIAGSLARKKIISKSEGTLLTDSPLFVVLLASVIIFIGALSLLPALALGPMIEQIMLWSHYGF